MKGAVVIKKKLAQAPISDLVKRFKDFGCEDIFIINKNLKLFKIEIVFFELFK